MEIVKVELFVEPGVNERTDDPSIGERPIPSGTVGKRDTLPARPRLPRVTVALLDSPACKLRLTGLADMVKSEATMRTREKECDNRPVVPVMVRVYVPLAIEFLVDTVRREVVVVPGVSLVVTELNEAKG